MRINSLVARLIVASLGSMRAPRKARRADAQLPEHVDRSLAPEAAIVDAVSRRGKGADEQQRKQSPDYESVVEREVHRARDWEELKEIQLEHREPREHL